MYFLSFEATPRMETVPLAGIAGAYINCWIERPTLEEAISVAQAQIREQGWIVDEPDEAGEVTEEDFPPGAEGREYYEQALTDKEVLVFHCYPEVEDEDEEK